MNNLEYGYSLCFVSFSNERMNALFFFFFFTFPTLVIYAISYVSGLFQSDLFHYGPRINP